MRLIKISIYFKKFFINENLIFMILNYLNRFIYYINYIKFFKIEINKY